MAHSKSVSWHVSNSDYYRQRAESLDGVDEATTTSAATPTNKIGTKRKAAHTPSLSISSDISYYSPANSPTKRFRSRQINPPTPIVSPTKERDQASLFETLDHQSSSSSASSSDDNANNITSPYILNSQPNLQDVFISLANKERRVLEAKEELKIAQKELGDFKTKWSSVLNIPSVITSPDSSPPVLRRRRKRSGHTASFRGSIGRSGLGITIPEMHNNEINDEYNERQQEQNYKHICEQANEIESIHSTATTLIEPTTSLLRQVKHVLRSTIKAIVFGLLGSGNGNNSTNNEPEYQHKNEYYNDSDDNYNKHDNGDDNENENENDKKNKHHPNNTNSKNNVLTLPLPNNSSVTRSYYEAAAGVKFPRLASN